MNPYYMKFIPAEKYGARTVIHKMGEHNQVISSYFDGAWHHWRRGERTLDPDGRSVPIAEEDVMLECI